MAFNSDGKGKYWADILWWGQEDVTLTVEAFTIEHDPTTGAIARYPRHTRLERPIHSGDKVEWRPELAPKSFGEWSVRVAATLPAGMAVFQHTISAAGPTGPRGWLGGGSGPLADLRLVLPRLPDVEFTASIDAAGPTGVSSLTTAPLVAGRDQVLELPMPPAAIAPSDYAMGDMNATTFSWRPVDNAVYYVDAYSEDMVFYQIATSGTSATVPDLTAIGVPPPSGAYHWKANAIIGVTSLDDFAAGKWGHGWAYSTTRSFIATPP